MSYLTLLSADIHRENERWWRDPATNEPLSVHNGEKLMLIVSEISEAMEGERKDLMDDKLPHRKMAEVELADALIRIFDLAGARDYSFYGIIPGGELNSLNAYYPILVPLMDYHTNKAEALFEIVKATGRVDSDLHGLAWVVCLILAYAAVHAYDMDGAVAEKRAFNKVRADHKPEARLAAGGKKW